MSFRRVKSILLAYSAASVFLAVAADANAGGLAVREQSAYGQGSSYAGVAAGGSLSSMFWNPATMTQVQGVQSESVLSGLIPSTTNSPSGGSFSGALGGTGNIGHSALVPSSYFSYQFNQSLWVGLSVNAPFGLSETFPDNWAGRIFAAGGESLKTYNFTPSIAYKLNDWISVGAGFQIQYASAAFTQGIPGLPPPFGVGGLGLTQQAGLSGSGMGYGFTAGVTLTPTPFTTVGVGYRSGINQKINGTFVLPGGPAFNAPFSTPGSVNTTFNIPGILSVGLRQKLTPQWTALATVEWSNWSRAGTSNVLQPNGAAATVVLNPAIIPFQYKDGWFFSLGAEYQWSPAVAFVPASPTKYRRSPTRFAALQFRTPTVPGSRSAAPTNTTPRRASI